MRSKLIIFILAITATLSLQAKESSETFEPWYTGTFLTSAYACRAPGVRSFQVLLYGLHYKTAPEKTVINPWFIFKVGLTSWMDTGIIVECLYKNAGSKQALKYGDTTPLVGFQLCKDEKGTYKPNIRLAILEFIPTGKYKNLSPTKHGVDASTSGAYETTFALSIAKTTYWMPKHPINFILNFQYYIPTNVHVKGFNYYGGGFGTDGKVNPGNTFIGVFAFEFSFTQRSAFGLDIAYTHKSKTTFSGTPGTTALGTTAVNYAPSSHVVDINPLLQYYFTPKSGGAISVDFTTARRNTIKYTGVFLTWFVLF